MIDRAKEIAARAAFKAADDAWQVQLVATFGKDAADVRYTSHANGAEGTALRAAWDARKAASDSWTNAKQDA